MSPRIKKALLLAAGIFLWIFVTVYLAGINSWLSAKYSIFPRWAFNLAFAGFLTFTAFYIRQIFSRIERLDVLTMLWRLFIIGMAGITFMLTILVANRLLIQYLTTDIISQILAPFFYTSGIFALLIFFLSGVFIFKRFVLYQKTRRKLIGWNIFLGFLIVVIFITLSKGLNLIPPGVASQLNLTFNLLFGLLLLYLSTNVSWTAYLNFNQKLKAIGLFVLVIVVAITYLASLNRLPDELQLTPNTRGFLEDYVDFKFILFLFAFTVIYSGISILVLFFNLPTSSVFELKSNEIASSIKINQAIQGSLNYGDILTTLLDASMLSANAQAGWIEVVSPNGAQPFQIRKGVEEEEIKQIESTNQISDKIREDLRYILVKNTRRHKTLKDVDSRFRSLLATPVINKNELFAVVYVANEVSNSFEDVTVSSVNSFAEQAGAAIENATLIRNAIDLERYQEQLKIAKAVQKELLPSSLPPSDRVKVVVLNETADEIGGDYYDMVEDGKHKLKIAVGDVSGKGTTAAFYMAEVKGIFHALSQAQVDVTNFVKYANQAISNCFQNGQFMTLTYLEIDVDRQEIEMIRAGHCPAFFYCAEKDEIQSLRKGTLGLGIVRNGTFGNFIGKPQKIPYKPGDFMILYTDGIVEARNPEGEEYGYERFEEIIQAHKKNSPTELAQNLVESVKAFAQQKVQDDYTVLMVKFLEEQNN